METYTKEQALEGAKKLFKANAFDKVIDDKPNPKKPEEKPSGYSVGFGRRMKGDEWVWENKLEPVISDAFGDKGTFTSKELEDLLKARGVNVSAEKIEQVMGKGMANEKSPARPPVTKEAESNKASKPEVPNKAPETPPQDKDTPLQETAKSAGWNVKGFLQGAGIIGLASGLGAVVAGGATLAVAGPALLVAAPVVALTAGAMALSNHYQANAGSAVGQNSPSQGNDAPQKEVKKSGPDIDIIQNNKKPMQRFANQMMDSTDLAANMQERIAPLTTGAPATLYEYKSKDGQEVIGTVDTSRLFGDKYELINEAGLVIGYLNAQTFQESIAHTKGSKHISPEQLVEQRNSGIDPILIEKLQRDSLDVAENSFAKGQQTNIYNEIRAIVASIAGEELTKAMEEFATRANGGVSLKNDLIVSSGAGGVKQASNDINRS